MIQGRIIIIDQIPHCQFTGPRLHSYETQICKPDAIEPLAPDCAGLAHPTTSTPKNRLTHSPKLLKYPKPQIQTRTGRKDTLKPQTLKPKTKQKNKEDKP